MTFRHSPDVGEEIVRQLKKKDASFLKVAALKANLPPTLRKKLGIGTNAKDDKVVSILKKHMGDRFRTYKKGDLLFIGCPQEPEAFLLEKLKKKPGGLTHKKLRKGLPMTRAAFTKALNKLLAEGFLLCQFRKEGVAEFLLLKAPPLSPDS